MAPRHTPLPRLLGEALGLAVAFLALFFALHMVAMHYYGPRAMTDHAILALQVGGAAALFHILAEYTGFNGWYCRHHVSK